MRFRGPICLAMMISLLIAGGAAATGGGGSQEATANATGVTGTDTAGVDPDSYSCSQPGYIDFENYADGFNLSENAINGIQFTTTNGYTWLVGDFATGSYNGKYP